ncbi:DUF6452 family protein [Kordia sp.]|uniref:DUF6452 family protein n=1 Tax=Kordia sp. TaxID=1965332 RepID=UPI003D2A3BF9
MKKLSYIGIIALVITTTVLSFSCEKDDICAEGTLTTPRLVIEFFDAEISDTTGEDVAKNVTNLFVEALNPNLDPDTQSTIQDDAATVNTISIPLHTQENSTVYRFFSEYETDSDGNITAGNSDIITFNYETSEVFLSRACGYVTNYRLDDAGTGVVVTTDTDNWIDPTTGIAITQFTIQDETIAHVKIYH